MSRVCESCSRGSLLSVSRSHSNIATKHRQFLNLQVKKIGGKRRRICTNCLKTLAKKARKV
ncbi:50S ribosomal protein L28 [Patescibacteria group bacterium]|nr:MAG: 50S ribosomal protein L28 [Patescibacteria group bacterium]